MAPMSSPAKISGLVRAMFLACASVSSWELWRKPPKSESETSAAEPMANPLPMAAVVLPAASSASVLSLTYSPIFAISAIPPALSLMGPYPSIASERGRLESIPRAERATP